MTVSGGTIPYAVASGDAKVATATVDKSTITIKGVAKGTATITVTDKGKKNSGKITVTVKEEGLTFDKKNVGSGREQRSCRDGFGRYGTLCC